MCVCVCVCLCVCVCVCVCLCVHACVCVCVPQVYALPEQQVEVLLGSGEPLLSPHQGRVKTRHAGGESITPIMKQRERLSLWAGAE